MFQTRNNGCLTVASVDACPKFGYVRFEPTYNGEERHYDIESISYTLANAVLWAPTERPWTLAAGKPSDDQTETDWRHVNTFASLDLLLGELPTMVGYPIVEITYMRPDGKVVHFDPDTLTGE